MDMWTKARSFVQEAAKRSQELTMEAAKRSQEITIGGSRLSDIVSEASKRSMELAAEASKNADLIKIEAIKHADLIRLEALKRADLLKLESLDRADQINLEALETFGVTDELREFVKEITLDTFKEFPLPDDSPMPDIPTVSNVRQDLTEWQATHANLVLGNIKEISKLRYELCPRFMKDRQFWRIYFTLVNSRIEPYEKKYMENLKLKEQEDKAKQDQISQAASRLDGTITNQQSKTSKSSAEQDLDVFLLGDLGDDDDDDDGPDDGDDEGFDDDDFDKIVDSSEDEGRKDSKK